MFSAVADDHSGKESMNDISFNDYKNFSKEWGLVTIRFRKDSGEMRLTYGNEAALKVLNSGAINYPDGAIFAKIGFHTNSDPQFESSVVPNGIRRYQFMVKDKKKYKSTGGWGYGLFDPDGKTFAEDPKITQDACYACHTMVENRGDVFSQPFSQTKDVRLVYIPVGTSAKSINYQDIQVRELPEFLKKAIPSGFKKVRNVSNENLRKNLFQGTLDEMKPVLEKESRLSKLPSLFASQDFKRFVLIIPTKSQECMEFGGFEVLSTDLNNNPMITKYCSHD